MLNTGGRSRWPRVIQRLPRPYPTTGASREQRRGMHLIWWDGILASAAGAFINEFVSLYMLALGASSTTVGLRATVNSAASLAAPLLGAWLVARFQRRKVWVLLGPGGLARLTVLLMAGIPLVAQGQTAVILFMALFAIQAFAGAVGQPAWNSILGDIVPLPVRGRYMGSKMMFNNIAVTVMLPIAGWLIARIGGVSGYQVSWLIAALIGFVATSTYWRVPEVVATGGVRTDSGGGLRAGWGAVLRDRRFLLFCVINFVWTFGIQLSAPYFTVHMSEDLGFSADTIAYIATVTTIFNVLALRFAGELVDRFGAPRMTAVSMLLVPLMPMLWIIARTPLHVGLVKIYGFLAWAGFRVATTPLILMLARDEHRSHYVAVFNTVNGVANMLGALPAAWLYANLGFSANLLASAGGRLLGGLLFVCQLRSGAFASRRAEREKVRSDAAAPAAGG